MSETPERRPLPDVNDARMQAAEKLGFMAGVFVHLGDGKSFEIPNPSLLDPEQQARYDQLQFEMEKLDRHPDPVDPEGKPLLDKNGQPRKGEVKIPHRVGNELVENYETRLAKALFGNDYERFVNAGGRPSQIGVHWSEMRQVMAEREAADDKSNGSDQPVGDVSETD